MHNFEESSPLKQMWEARISTNGRYDGDDAVRCSVSVLENRSSKVRSSRYTYSFPSSLSFKIIPFLSSVFCVAAAPAITIALNKLSLLILEA